MLGWDVDGGYTHSENHVSFEGRNYINAPVLAAEIANGSFSFLNPLSTPAANAALNVTEMGRNIVSVPQLYGTTYTLFAHILPKLGVNVKFAKSDRPADMEALIDENTRAIFCETVGNPAGNVCDIEALATVAHRYGVPLIVDNTVATPMLIRPADFGADIIVHSLTKFLGGHGTTLGGIVVDCGRRTR